MNRQERIEKDGLEEEPIEFYGGEGEHPEFSNFSRHGIWLPHPFTDVLTLYNSGEYRFQAMKATNEEDHDYVNEASSSAQSKKRGREIELRPGWDQGLNYYVMVETVTNKALQHRDILLSLLRTEGRAIWEDSPTDDIWGIRYRNDYRGKNLLGKSWMQARDYFYLTVREVGEVVFNNAVDNL